MECGGDFPKRTNFYMELTTAESNHFKIDGESNRGNKGIQFLEFTLTIGLPKKSDPTQSVIEK